MAERYKLPEEWGGAEIEGFPTDDGLWVDVVVGPVASTLPRVLLTPVKPPTPPEPEPGAYMLGKRLCMRTGPDPGKCHVYETGGMWAEERFEKLWEMFGGPDVTITRLVPERVEPPVELPWRHTDNDGDRVTVTLGGNVDVNGNVVVLTNRARCDMIAALRYAAWRPES